MPRSFKILYGSQGGTAEDVAYQFQRQAKMLSFKPVPCLAMVEYDRFKLPNEMSPVLFVCSTTGQGEMPDNMRLFWKFLCRKDLPNSLLRGVRFAVIALGDSSYRQFNFSGKKLSRRLQQLGAEEICQMALCDDQHELGPDKGFPKALTE